MTFNDLIAMSLNSTWKLNHHYIPVLVCVVADVFFNILEIIQDSWVD